MTESEELTDMLDVAPDVHDAVSSPLSTSAASATTIDPRHLASILAFLGREIDNSASMLRDLAMRLSHELCALGQIDCVNAMQRRVIASTIALQNEDRVQQRLRDLCSVLALLEQALKAEQSIDDANFERSILDQVTLEEIRHALAVKLGRADPHHPPSTTPSIGDVDLF